MRCQIVCKTGIRQRIKDSQPCQSTDLVRSGGVAIANHHGQSQAGVFGAGVREVVAVEKWVAYTGSNAATLQIGISSSDPRRTPAPQA